MSPWGVLGIGGASQVLAKHLNDPLPFSEPGAPPRPPNPPTAET